MFVTYIILAMVLQNVNSKLSVDSAVSSYELLAELFDAYDRKDYVDVWIKLIDLKLKLDPPGLYSQEMIQLLLLRRRLVKLHKYYLKIHPSRAPTKNFTVNYDSNLLTEQDITPILEVFNSVLQETNSLVSGQNTASGDQISNIFGSIANNLIKTTEDAISANIPEAGREDSITSSLPDNSEVSNGKPLLGAPLNDVKLSEETNNAIYDSMTQLSNLIESAPRPDQSNFISPTVEINVENTRTTITSITTTTDSPNISNNSTQAAVIDDAIESLFSFLNIIANPDDNPIHPE